MGRRGLGNRRHRGQPQIIERDTAKSKSQKKEKPRRLANIIAWPLEPTPDFTTESSLPHGFETNRRRLDVLLSANKRPRLIRAVHFLATPKRSKMINP